MGREGLKGGQGGGAPVGSDAAGVLVVVLEDLPLVVAGAFFGFGILRFDRLG